MTEIKGAVPGTLGLTGFAVVAAATLTALPLVAALLGALATWMVVAIGGYLAQATVLPSWERDVHDLARQRYDAAQARRGRPSPHPSSGHRSLRPGEPGSDLPLRPLRLLTNH